MITFDRKNNLLMQNKYQYSLQDVDEPNLYREIFDYEHSPKVAFNMRNVPMVRQPLHPEADPAPVQADEPDGRAEGHDPAERVFPLHEE